MREEHIFAAFSSSSSFSAYQVFGCPGCWTVVWLHHALFVQQPKLRAAVFFAGDRPSLSHLWIKRKRATPPEQPQTLQDQLQKPEPEQNQNQNQHSHQHQPAPIQPSASPTPPSAKISAHQLRLTSSLDTPVTAIPFFFSFFFWENCQLWSFFLSPILAPWINYCYRPVARQPVAHRRPPSPTVAHLSFLSSRFFATSHIFPSSYPSPAVGPASRILSVATCRDATPRKLKLLKRALTGNAFASSANLLS